MPAGPIERVDREWGRTPGGPASKPAPERAGKMLEGDHFAYKDDGRPMAYRGAWQVGEPEIAPAHFTADDKSRLALRAWLPDGKRRWAAAAFVVALIGGFVGISFAAPHLGDLLGSPGQESVAVLLRTVPSGATVAIDGQALDGRTPLAVKMPLTSGLHQVTYTLEGQKPVKARMTVKPGRAFVQSQAVLLEHGSVQVNTTPPGATILLDGKKVGKSPVLLEKVPFKGEHTLSAELIGFRSVDLPIPGERPVLHTENIEFESTGAKGEIVVRTDARARVMLAGRVVGEAGEDPIALPLGQHTLVLDVPTLQRQMRVRVTVKADTVGRYFFELGRTGI